MASKTVVMPDLGESVPEGTVIEWFVKPGDKVNVDDDLCLVSTDKADAEVPSPAEGYVQELLAAVNDIVEVEGPLLIISDEPPEGVEVTETADPAPTSAPAASEPVALQASKTAPEVPSGFTLSSTPTMTIPTSSAPAASAYSIPSYQAPPAFAAPAAPAAPAPSKPAKSSKPDRWLPFGHPDGASAYRYPQPRVEEGDTVEDFSRRRSIIAEHMVISQSVSPHVVTVAEVDMTNLVTLRNAHKKRLKAQGIGVTYLTFLLKATCQALREFPIMNSVVGDKQIIMKGSINLGFAAETDAGLVVPVIRNADEFNTVGLAKSVSRLATKARDNNLEPSDLAGGTFTVSNPGLKGNLYGGAIINQPQVGILRMGELKKRPMVVQRDGQDVIAIRSMMYLALSYDHRIVDGVTGNGFLFRVRELLEEANFDL